MYATQFDGNAAFSGGGFMPSQVTHSTDSSLSPAKNRDSQGIVPLTVKQINQGCLSTNEISSVVIDGVDVSNVTLVGLVLNRTERATDVGFVLDDGTGKINVNRWVNESFDVNEMEKISDGNYVRIHARLKGFQGKRNLVAYSVRRLTDFNEFTYHFMECMYVHMYNTKLRVNSAPSATHLDYMMPSVNGTTYQGQQGGQQNQFSELGGVDQMVMDYLQQPANLAKEKGVHINDLVQRFNIPKDKIMASINALEGEGLVYSTVDDEHYKSTGNA